MAGGVSLSIPKGKRYSLILNDYFRFTAEPPAQPGTAVNQEFGSETHSYLPSFATVSPGSGNGVSTKQPAARPTASGCQADVQ